MNPMLLTATILAVLAVNVNAIFDITTSSATGASIALASGTGIGTVAAVAGGALILKALALGALSVAARQKRSTVEDDATFAFIAQNEPAQCYRRLICELAGGVMPQSENQIILDLFSTETPATSPKFDFAVAASVGKQVRSAEACEIRYSCPLSGQQIDKLFN